MKNRKIMNPPQAGMGEMPPATKALNQEASAKNSAAHGGRFNFDLLILIGVVLLANVPFIGGRFMPVHDTKQALAFFDYFYSNLTFFGELPRWMVYGLYGLDASAYHITFMSAVGYLTMFAGKCFGVGDTLMLFSITVCLEQLIFLLGLYLLAKRIFTRRLTVFCVCLTAAGTIMSHFEIPFNFRIFELLPLEFYLIHRLRYDGKGHWGWLAGIVAVLGPLGGAAYFYPLWGFIIVLFSLTLFWGEFRVLLAMVKTTQKNIFAALAFFVTASAFMGVLWKATDNFLVLSAGRDSTGGISIATFLTYGQYGLGEMWKSLLLPMANISEASGRLGMTDYLGFFGIFCLPLALRSLNTSSARPFAIVAAALFALSCGGLLACAIFYFPGMKLYRHIGFTTAVLKLMLLLLAGFGFEGFLRALREGVLKKYATFKMLLAALFVIACFVDLNVGGAMWAKVCESLKTVPNSFTKVLAEAAIYPLLRGGLLAMFILALWYSCRTGAGRTKLVLFLLVAGAIGDCLLFQIELRNLLHLADGRIAHPAAKLGFNEMRTLQYPDVVAAKFKAYNIGIRGAEEYQMAISSDLQYDPPTIQARVDWFPKNVLGLIKVLDKGNVADREVICGQNRPKLRLVSQAVYVGSDEEALALLQAQPGWENKVILQADKNTPITTPSPTAETLPFIPKVNGFSANSLSLSFSNSAAATAWLVYSDAYAPGWHATVNGKPAAVLKAYAAFKAIPVEPGNNRVELYYHKGLLSTCLSIFAATAGLAAFFALFVLIWLAAVEPFTSSRSPSSIRS